jgi:hypothetical protein
VKEYASGQSTLEQALEQLLKLFAETADDIRPGAIENSARRTSLAPESLTHPQSSAMPFRTVAMVRADLTVVLRMLATTPPGESPERREQRSAARATLVTLAELDGTFAELGTWLTAQGKLENRASRAQQ